MRAWPGHISNRSVVIPIASGRFADVRGRLTVAGVDLEAKDECRVTVLNSACVTDVLRAMRERDVDEALIAGHFATCDWTWRDTRER